MSDRGTRFAPDYSIPPGSTLREVLERLGMSQAELAARTDLSTKHVNQIVQGIAPLTHETAILFERVTGVPSRIWNNLEADYRDLLARQEEEVTSEDRALLRALPLKELREAGHVPADQDEISTFRAVLQFFRVANRAAFERTWLQPAAKFKRSQAFKADPHALAAWLRIGEIEAQSIRTKPYEAAAFRKALEKVRRLTRRTDFSDELRAVCAEAGVAVVFVPELPGCRASGAVRWLSPTKAVLQLSDRYKHDDNFWFSFFHEAGHILFHSKRDTFIDDGGAAGVAEDEANHFAEDALIPPDRRHELSLLRTMADVEGFAAEINIAPGIVIGRLHNDKHWPWNRGNSLRRKIRIVSRGKSQA
jgi:HTH-type transcriptional regulator/antitoxin HigA